MKGATLTPQRPGAQPADACAGADTRSLKTDSFKKDGIPSPLANPYSWSKTASILAISAPPPVGFSWCDAGGPGGDGYSCGDWNDTRTAISNRDSLTNWIKLFPEFAGNDMYIAGESYAGIYVPTLVEKILEVGEPSPTATPPSAACLPPGARARGRAARARARSARWLCLVRGCGSRVAGR